MENPSQPELTEFGLQALETNLAQISAVLLARGWMLATAESCTGGLVASACTSLSGSSQWFERGFVSYSNAAKTGMLGVSAGLIAQYGAVSEAVVRAMAEGAIHHSTARVAAAVTGIAGPTGGSVDKPVGTVWFAWCLDGAMFSERRHFDGGRAAVREAALCHTLERLADLLATAAP